MQPYKTGRFSPEIRRTIAFAKAVQADHRQAVLADMVRMP